MSSLVIGLSPPHINVGDDKQEWLTLLHLIATHRPARLQHEYTTILIQVGDVMLVRVISSYVGDCDHDYVREIQARRSMDGRCR